MDQSRIICKRHNDSYEKIKSGKFDILNPCSWCSNIDESFNKKPIFYYREYGTWEFPFLAEATCHNFKEIDEDTDIKNTIQTFSLAKEIYEQKNRIYEIGNRYGINWAAFRPDDISEFLGVKIEPGKIIYPHNWEATKFYRDVGNIRSDFFELRIELSELTKELRQQKGIHDDMLYHFLSQREELMQELLRQIETLESIKTQSPFTTFSMWAFSSVSGGIAWDTLKHIVCVVDKIVRG